MQLLLLILSLSITSVHCTSEILDGPHSVNTTINSTANFTCLVSGGSEAVSAIIWFINGESVEHHPPLIPVGGNTLSYFEVTASLSRNASNISFLLITSPSFTQIPSTNALLLIQDVLDPPSWIAISFTGNNLTLQWSRPYTLDSIPILGYRVTVQSSTVDISDNTTTSLTVGDVGGLSSSCSNVMASISALNPVGYSDMNTYTILHPGDISVKNVSNSLQFTDGNNNELLTLQMNASIHFNCHGIVPLKVTFSVHSLHDDNPTTYTLTNNTILSDTSATNTTSNTSVSVIRSSVTDSIQHNAVYAVDLTVIYDGGVDVIKNIIEIRSFDTQTIETGKSTSNKLCVRCRFLPNTVAKGCLVHVAINGNNLWSMDSSINGDGNSLSEWVCSPKAANISNNDTYTITVFDIESDQTTTEVTSINEKVDWETFNSVLVNVRNDTPTITMATNTVHSSTSMNTNNIIISTSMYDHTTITTQLIIRTSVLGASPSSSPAVIINASMPTVIGIGEQPPESTSMTVIVLIAGIGVVSLLLVLVSVGIVIGCLIITQRRRKVSYDRRHQIGVGSNDDMLMSVNELYASDNGIIDKPPPLPPSNGTVGEVHIYSEIGEALMKKTSNVMADKQYSIIPPLKEGENHVEKKDQSTKDRSTKEGDDEEWIPNPTYQLAPFGNNPPQPPPTDLINTNAYTDDRSRERVPTEVCPAYGSSGGANGNGRVVYEDLTHIV